MNNWNPSSWRDFPIKQQPTYGDLEKLTKVENELSSYPPLIFAGEALNLKKIFISKGFKKELVRKDIFTREKKEVSNIPVVNVPLPVIMQVLKYCEDNQIYDKLGSYQNFYYKLNQIRREYDEINNLV